MLPDWGYVSMAAIWTKELVVKIQDNRSFKLFVSNANDGDFYASCLWYRFVRKNNTLDGEGKNLVFELKTFRGSSEDQVYKKTCAWLAENFGSDFKLIG